MNPANSVKLVFASGTAAAETKTLDNNHNKEAGSVQLRFEYTGFTGTLDFQGRPSADAAWTNLFYVRMADGAPTSSNDQLSFTTETSNQDYIILNPYPFMQVVMTRSAGSLEGYAYYFEHPYNIPMTIDTELPAAAAGADGAANQTAPSVDARNSIFNGTTWDRQRSNTNVTLLASASRTTTQTGADTPNYNHRGIHVVLDMTVPGTGSVTLTIQGKDEVSGEYYTILAGAAVTTDTTNVYKVYPGLTAAANAAANDVLPRTFRILVTANNANAATYSVGYSLVV